MVKLILIYKKFILITSETKIFYNIIISLIILFVDFLQEKFIKKYFNI